MNLCLQSIPLARILCGNICQHSNQSAFLRSSLLYNVRHIYCAVSIQSQDPNLPRSLLAAHIAQKWQYRDAGHSKWSNIKNIKGAKDMERGRIFSRISLTIRMALKDGSTNPTANTKLAEALENARKNNMPKSTINNILENSQKTMQNAKEHYLEYRGGGGVCLYIYVYSDNVKRAKAYINGAVKRSGFAENKSTGAVRHMFVERGLITTQAKLENKPVTLSEAEEHAIEAGAEDVELNEDVLEFLCSPYELKSVKTSLEKYGYNIDEANVEFLPVSPVILDDENMEALGDLIAKVEDLDEVVKVFPNV